MTDHHLRDLLTWAVDFITIDVATMRDSFCDKHGNFSDEDIALEVRESERWLAEAREALK